MMERARGWLNAAVDAFPSTKPAVSSITVSISIIIITSILHPSSSSSSSEADDDDQGGF